MATLSAICHAVGVLEPTDSSELHHKPLLVTVKTTKYEGDIKNAVKGYEAVAKVAKQGSHDTFSEPIDQGTEAAQQQQAVKDMEESAPWL